jgi:hypothetical protein
VKGAPSMLVASVLHDADCSEVLDAIRCIHVGKTIIPESLLKVADRPGIARSMRMGVPVPPLRRRVSLPGPCGWPIRMDLREAS